MISAVHYLVKVFSGLCIANGVSLVYSRAGAYHADIM